MCDRYIRLIYLAVLTAFLFTKVSCMVGDNCTASDISGCGTGPEYVCLSDDTCACAANHYEMADKSCVKKPKFGDPCTTQNTCLGNLTCDANDSKCKCDKEYYNIDNQCFNKPVFNESCQTDSKPCLNNLTCLDEIMLCGCEASQYYNDNSCSNKPEFNESCTAKSGCLGNLTCHTNDLKCVCGIEYYNSENQCLNRPVFNESCSAAKPCLNNLTCDANDLKCKCDKEYYNIDNQCFNTAVRRIPMLCMAIFNESCQTDSKPCLNNLTCLDEIMLCGCEASQYYNDNSCSNKPEFNESCTAKSGCLGNLTCHTNDLKCVCGIEYYNSENQCLNRPVFNESCSAAKPCLNNLTCLLVNERMLCGCAANQYNNNNSCSDKPKFNENCTAESGCLGNLTCYTKNLKCLCGIEYYNSENQCLNRPVFNESCQTDSKPCLYNLTCLLINERMSCGCEASQYNNNNYCRDKPTFEENCSGHIPCINNLICNENEVCGCNASQYNDNINISCINKPTFEGNCSGDIPCINNLICNNNEVCGCNASQYNNNNISCINKPTFEKNCSGDIPCINNLICNENEVCGCNASQYNNNNISCINKLTFEGNCSGGIPCINNLICNNNEVCGCNASQYNNNNISCINKPTFEGNCSSGIPCIDNLICNNNEVCGCNASQYNNNNTSCINKGGYGAGCTTSESCGVANGSCYDATDGSETCTCNENFYTDTNTCKPVDELKPDTPTFGEVTANSIRISWSVNGHSAIKRFNVKGYINSNIAFNQPVTDHTVRTVTITRLLPFTTYTNITVEAVIKTDRNPDYIVTSNPLLNINTPKAGYGETCISNDSCNVTNGNCYDNNGNKTCRCLTDFYRNTDTSECKTVSEFKPVTTGFNPVKSRSITVNWNKITNQQFVTSLTVDSDNFSAKNNIDKTATSTSIDNLTPNTTYNNIRVISIVTTDRGLVSVRSDSLSVTTKLESGSSCTTGSNECVVNLQCIKELCQCPATDYEFNNYCYSKVGYGQDCSNSNEACNVTNGDCYENPTDNTKTCRCSTKYYRDIANSQCSLVSNLRPGEFSVTRSTMNSLTFQWTSSDVITFIRQFNISGTGFSDKVVNNDQTTVIVTGLSAGTMYPDLKVTAIVITDRGSDVEETSSNVIGDSTNPGKPGPLDPDNVYNTTQNINIQFTRPDGGVESYNVNIKVSDTDDINDVIPSKDAMYTIDAGVLQPGREYTISMTAIYNGKASDTFTAPIQTLSAGSGPVQKLITTSVTSRNMTVSWEYPENDSGNLTAYILDVKQGNTCLLRYIYVYNTDSPPALPGLPMCPNQSTISANLQNGIIQDIPDRSPYTNYTLMVTPYNEAGFGTEKTIVRMTDIEAAGNISVLTVNNVNATSFVIKWKKPAENPGPTRYIITIYEQSNLADKEVNQLYKNLTVPGYDKEEYEVSDVTSFWYFRFTLQATTDVGPSNVQSVEKFQTKSTNPGMVTDLEVKLIANNYTAAYVTWSCLSERDRNGEIENYILTSQIDNENLGKPIVIQNDNGCSFERIITVKPGKKSTVYVRATNTDSVRGTSASTIYIAPVGKPVLSEEENVVVLNKITEVGQTEFTISVCSSCLQDKRNGEIMLTALLVCVKNKCDIGSLDNKDALLKFTTWKTAKSESFVKPYRATSDSWLNGAGTSANYYTFTIGNEKECDTKPDEYICNGPLAMDTEYQIIAVSCSSAGCTHTGPHGAFKTMAEPSNIVVPIVVTLVVLLIIVVVVIGGLYYFRRYKHNKPLLCRNNSEDNVSIKSFESNTTKSSTPRNRPIKLEHFTEQLTKLSRDSNLLFSEEFEGIGELSPKHSCEAALMEENKPKNRYVNILPFDHSRVKLLPIDDDDTTDYINASYIPGYKSQREYIASQGPLITNISGKEVSTIPDFWRMIWEQRVVIIVMLSDLTEKGKPKVDKYWQDQGESEQYGDIIVEVTSVSVLNKYTIKIFEMKLGDEIRKVRHFFLPGWEDYRANLQPEDVLEFLSVVRQEVKPIDKGPMVVHCSAGVGRTGTFIALDIFQQYINERDLGVDIDIYDLVLRMRNFRHHMVQSEKQYIFIHETIKEIINQRKRRLMENDTVIYENTGGDHIYSNDGFVGDDIYMNVENGKPTTVL